jgi:phosphotriesterase-related protein
VLDIVEAEGVEPDKWIFVHAQVETDMDALIGVAKRGAWIELDGIGPDSVDCHVTPLLALLEAGFVDQIMLSHDKGWYTVGEPGGGDIKPYTYLFTDFVPLLKERGVGQAALDTMMITNPAKAFLVG